MQQRQFVPAAPIDNMSSDGSATRYHSMKDRLRTFTKNNWLKSQTPESLANAGFFRTQNAGADDVQCFSCGIRIFDWDPSDEPLEEHLRWSQGCKFATLMRNLKHTRHLIASSFDLLDLLEQAAQMNGLDIAGNGEVAASIRTDVTDRNLVRMVLQNLYNSV